MEMTANPELDIRVNELKKASLVIRAVNHSLRQQIINLIHKSGTIIVTEIYKKLDLEQSVASQHLGILRKAGFVSTERRGKFIYYKINYNRFEEVDNLIQKILN